MKKAFDQNVSRAKPRVRPANGSLESGEDFSEATSSELMSVAETQPSSPEALSSHAELELTRTPEPEKVAPASESPAPPPSLTPPRVESVRPKSVGTGKAQSNGSTPKRNGNGSEASPEVRRERLKARLKAAREDPRPEPLPATVAEAGNLAVERISTLQAEVVKLKGQNFSLNQELESSRRQSEKATE